MLTVLNHENPQGQLRAALDVASDVLEVNVCWYHAGDFHFILGNNWSVSITAETAGRLRIDTWRGLRPRDRKWARADDCNRVARLVLDARESAYQPV